jgi:hypothetical protein
LIACKIAELGAEGEKRLETKWGFPVVRKNPVQFKSLLARHNFLCGSGGAKIDFPVKSILAAR